LTHLLTSILGLWLLLLILRSMIRIALMNRHYRDFFAEGTGRAVHMAAALRLRSNRDTEAVHAVLLWFFPAYILLLIVVYFIGAMSAFALLYWERAVGTWHQAFIASGSALNTLGFATPASIAGQWLSIPEGALGLGVVVFLFTFIPNYQAIIRSREDKTSWLYARAGAQPTGVTLLEWCQRTGMAINMRDVWEAWEDWFRMLGDTHSVLPMLTISPSVQGGQSWVLAASAVLDAASLAASSLEMDDSESPKMCIQTGTRAMLAIAEALGRASTSAGEAETRSLREECESARARLCAAGMTLRSTVDLETQWGEFRSLRERYQEALYFVARQTFAPLDGTLVAVAERYDIRSASCGKADARASAAPPKSSVSQT